MSSQRQAGARLYLRGRIWWTWFYDVDGARRVESTKCRRREAAEAVARDLERRAVDPEYAAARGASLTDALERLIRDRERKARAPGTLTMYATKAGHLLRVFGPGARLAEVTARSVDTYVDTRTAEGAANPTIAKELTTLRGALKIAKRRGEYPADIAAVMPEWSCASEPRKVWISEKDAAALLAALPPHRAAHVAFILATGARWSESVRAMREDINLEEGLVYIRGTKTAKSAAHVPIYEHTRPLLDRVIAYLDVRAAREGGTSSTPIFRPWTNVRNDLPRACERANLPEVSPTDLRRSAGKWLRARGLSPHIIGSFLRHADSRMAERVYADLDGDLRLDVLRRALPAAPGSTS